jgi:hypothetical protein
MVQIATFPQFSGYFCDFSKYTLYIPLWINGAYNELADPASP